MFLLEVTRGRLASTFFLNVCGACCKLDSMFLGWTRDMSRLPDGLGYSKLAPQKLKTLQQIGIDFCKFVSTLLHLHLTYFSASLKTR